MNEDVLEKLTVAPVEPKPGPDSGPDTPHHGEDQILYWNDVALEADRVDHTPEPDQQPQQAGPLLCSRALAIVHLAMYDAYAGVVNNPTDLPTYRDLSNLTPPPFSESAANVAIAAAAHTALSALYPRQRASFDTAHTNAGLGGGLQPGHTFGVRVAQRMLAERAGDPPVSASGYTHSLERGKHRVDPDNPGQGFYGPIYGDLSHGFAITDRHQLDAPPFDNPEYLAALKQVRYKGIAPELLATLPPNSSLPPHSSPRTAEETLIGIYWGYDGARGLGTPPRLYNQIVRVVAKAKKNDVSQNARLFAFVNAAMADAGILAWEQKYLHNLWRPVLGIREHSVLPNPLDPDADPFWLPLGAPRTNGDRNPPINGKNFTPNFPAYPSGHATFGAAALHMTRLFYGVTGTCPDKLFKGLSFVSDEFNGVNRDIQGTVRPPHARSFPGGLWDMIIENSRSRIFLGVHWSFDGFAVDDEGNPDLERNIGGVPLGLKIAEDIFNAGDCIAPKKPA